MEKQANHNLRRNWKKKDTKHFATLSHKKESKIKFSVITEDHYIKF